ncbi:MAG: hypothetical protein A2821_02430 [Candidatus Magasanikbacteria bacterium RIFCSPHIGHO2_01_FULL_41_23]|nr:MAG: hypothetical protein A2821_02430 [Candidatus Magasanikbacteria bacterium RIFCSPHIGHO2_01_FULL_41_23]OGH74852.1 MAG: hypothetical protein A3F22_04140 [Candidatus Magasanikbacteria bacterium RIFCSPHIGHO2_12_FULL_41_16]
MKVLMVTLTTKNSRGEDIHFSISKEGAREAGILPDSRSWDRAQGVSAGNRQYMKRLVRRLDEIGS